MAIKFDFARFFQIVSLIGPGILLMVPGGQFVAPLVPVIVAAIGEAEQIKGATGPEKKAHVMKIIDAGVIVANASGKVTLNAAEVQKVASDGIDAVIGAVAVIGGAKVVKVPA